MGDPPGATENRFARPDVLAKVELLPLELVPAPSHRGVRHGETVTCIAPNIAGDDFDATEGRFASMNHADDPQSETDENGVRAYLLAMIAV